MIFSDYFVYDIFCADVGVCVYISNERSVSIFIVNDFFGDLVLLSIIYMHSAFSLLKEGESNV